MTMNYLLSLNNSQYNRICNYWRIFEKLNSRIENFDYSKYKGWDEYCDDEEIIKFNAKIDAKLSELKEKLYYYEVEYVKYLRKIGFELNDASYDEVLFNLLNNGILINT